MAPRNEFRVDDSSHHAATGAALPDGSMRITNRAQLEQALVRWRKLPPKDREPAKKHIIARAHSLGFSKLLPHDWLADQFKANRAGVVKAHGAAGRNLLTKVLESPRALERLREMVAGDLEAQLDDLEAQLDAGLDELVKRVEVVEAQPAPGGPARTRVGRGLPAGRSAERDGHLAKAAHYERMAQTVTEAEQVLSYQKLAQQSRYLAESFPPPEPDWWPYPGRFGSP